MTDEIFDLNFPSDPVTRSAKRYLGEITMVGFMYPGGSGCPTTQIQTRVTARLEFLDSKNANLRVEYFTSDRLGNLTDTSFSVIESRVPLVAPTPIKISSSASEDYIKYYGVSVSGSSAVLLCYFYDKYSITVNGTSCRTGFNSSKTNVAMSALDGLDETAVSAEIT